ncbi:MAG: hypothetical protein Q7R66_21530 [Undibacterium sp.]|uniref:hypothetical protein n=1 Tax=Undibacterium sp. TaxID=1914977 RepID=UPI00271F3514|nr:hypothetical protein [Undibacterium sp.]MDO8654760.1 hypothetical protein [Undibacterium sp.]
MMISTSINKSFRTLPSYPLPLQYLCLEPADNTDKPPHSITGIFTENFHRETTHDAVSDFYNVQQSWGARRCARLQSGLTVNYRGFSCSNAKGD